MGSCLPSFLDRDETLPYLALAVCVIPRSPSSVPLVFLPLYFQLHIPRSLYYDPLFFVFLWLILYWLFPNPLFPSKPTRLWPTDPSVPTEVVPQVQVWYSHPQPPDPSPHPTPYFRIIFDTGSFAEPLCPTIPPPPKKKCFFSSQSLPVHEIWIWNFFHYTKVTCCGKNQPSAIHVRKKNWPRLPYN